MKKRHKILSIILALVIALGSIVTISIVSSSAESFTDENGISWTVVENKPGWAIKPTDRNSISGHVKIPSEYNGEPINMINSQAFTNCSNLTSVDIPNSITTIGNNAFEYCTGLTSVKIPDSVIIIDSSAFRNCKNLTSVDLPEGVTTIGASAFNTCSNLTSIELPDSITTIHSDAFANCTGLTSFSVPDGVTDVRAFSGCTNLTSVDLPEGVTTLGGFENCTNLTSITIPSSVTTLTNNAFEGCTSLTSINIPEGVTTIGQNCFYGCTSLAEISVPTTVTGIPTSAKTKLIYQNSFQETAWYNNQPDGVLYLNHICLGYKNTTPTGKLVIKDGTTEMAMSAFANCTGLTSLELPKGIKIIPYRAFDGCSGLTSITIPEGVTTIDTLAFRNCKNLTSVELPSSITSVGSSAFSGCTKLSDVSYPPTLDISIKSVFSNTAWYNSFEDGLIYIDNVFVGYKGTKPTGEIVIKDGTLTIGASALSGCTGLTSVKIPDSVTIIAANALKGCTGLTSVKLPEGVTEIGNFAFDGCTNLTSINIPNSLTTLNKGAFRDCSKLSNVTFPTRLTTINSSVFSGCTALTSITIPNNVNFIGDGAFTYCSNLVDVVIGNGVTTIDERAFFNCKKLESVTFGNNIKTIGDYAFANCESLKSVELPNGVEILDVEAFYQCTGIENIVLPATLNEVDTKAFAECGLIENLTVNCSYDVIDTDVFYNDTFVNVVLGENINSIEDQFANNESLENIVIPNTVTNIKDVAFVGSPNVTITTTSNSTAHKFANANNIPVNIIDAVNTVDPVSFEVTCDKPGYEFTVYKVADLVKTENPYEVRYDSLLTDIEDEIFEGNSEALLTELDKVDSSLLTEVVGTYSTDVDGSSKLFENLEPGIYYVRATNFPANVYSVQNSVFALPYYDATEGWIYEITPIPLATKVDESNPEIVKTITNSTKDNVNFTDVSLGDTVNFEIEASRVGSANVVESKDFRLNSYVVSDIMENGLTLNQDSFVVTLEDADGNTLTTLENTTDYVVNVVASEGADTTFTVSLTPEYLQEDEFYSSANVVIAYSAVLNKYSTREFDGNYNTATNLTYSNKTNVSATVEGNTVYAYTFGIEVNKYDDAGTPLAGSQFGLYLTEDDAKAMTNAIATGTSTDTGKVEFYTESNDVIRLASGTYYIVETKATESYNRYTDVIPVTITVNYGDTEINGTYIESAPENGIQLVEVKNSKVVIPNTGGDGAMYRYIIALAFAMLAVALFALKKRSSKKATAIK